MRRRECALCSSTTVPPSSVIIHLDGDGVGAAMRGEADLAWLGRTAIERWDLGEPLIFDRNTKEVGIEGAVPILVAEDGQCRVPQRTEGKADMADRHPQRHMLRSDMAQCCRDDAGKICSHLRSNGRAASLWRCTGAPAENKNPEFMVRRDRWQYPDHGYVPPSSAWQPQCVAQPRGGSRKGTLPRGQE